MNDLMNNVYVQNLLDLAVAHPYIFLFFSLIIGGETALLPALYLGAKGILSTTSIAICMIVATIISDTVWYFVGTGLSHGAGYIKLGERTKASVDRLAKYFDRRSLFILFMSKFVYGTRTAAQILCGMRRIPFKSYALVNIAGVVALSFVYIVMMYVIVRVLNMTVYSASTFQIGLLVSVGVIVLLQIIIGASIKKKWFQRS